LTKAQQGLWKYDEAGNTSTPPSEAQIDDVYRLRTLAMDAVGREDQKFFSDLENAILTEAQKPLMQRVRMARQRVVYNRGTDMWGAWGGSSESSVDLGRLIRQQHLTPEQLATVDPELAKYEEQAAAAFKAKYDAALNVQKSMEKWNSRMMAAQQAEGGNSMQ